MNTDTHTAQRSYCHPIDSNIIKVLDNPAVNMVFRKVLSLATDSSFGQIIAKGVPVNERSFPRIYEMVKRCAQILRIPIPYVVISGSVGFNAFTTGSDKKPYIVLGNMLVKAMKEEYPNALDIPQEVLSELYPNLTEYYNQSVVMTNFHSREKTDIAETISIMGSYPTGAYVNYEFAGNTIPYTLPNTLKTLTGGYISRLYCPVHLGKTSVKIIY